MRKMWTAKCSQCDHRFRSYSRTDMLANIRKHMWKFHEKWMKARMKAGRLAGGPGNPTTGMVMTALAQGIPIAMALIRLVRKPRWGRLETAVSSFEPYMKPEMRAAWQSVKSIKQIDIRRGG